MADDKADDRVSAKILLDAQQIAEYLQKLPNWQYHADRNALYFNYKFKDFSACFAMMTRIAMLAEQVNHHPDWYNSYRNLEIYLTSHDSGGITMRDIEMAHQIVALFVDDSASASVSA